MYLFECYGVVSGLFCCDGWGWVGNGGIGVGVIIISLFV